jgi:hypothetical protein
VEEMSFSFTVKTTNPLPIDAVLLTQEASSVLSRLLNQQSGVDLRFVFFDIDGDQNSINALMPRDDIFGFNESAFLGDGGYVMYGMNKYWRDFGEIPFYEFSVLEIHRSRSNAKVAVALALAVAVANILSVDFISDGGAGIVSMDETGDVAKDSLLKLAVTDALPAEVALQTFYQNMNL